MSTTLLAQRGGIAENPCGCDCTPAQCIPGHWCPMPDPKCPGGCSQQSGGGGCVHVGCSTLFTYVVTWQGTYVKNGVVTAWANPVGYLLYNWTFQGGAPSQGTFTITMTYTGQKPYPPCLSWAGITIYTIACDNNGLGGSGPGVIENLIVPLDQKTGKAVKTFYLSCSDHGVPGNPPVNVGLGILA